MNLAHDCRAFLLAAAVFSSGISLASGQLESCIESHGGLATWKSFGSVRYELTWTSAKGARRDEQMFDLRTRDGLIKSDAYTLGSSGDAVWIQPSLDALGGTPPRFYMWTPFYFFGMPFVFADPGAVHESLGRKSFQDQEYDAVRVTFQKGTGDTPEDFYLLYLDPGSGRLKLASYIVTFPAL